jgi:hypothetical protein
MLKLIKKSSGPSAVYATEDGAIYVSRDQRWVNTRRQGGWKGLVVTYTAVLRSNVSGAMDEASYAIARGTTLSECRARLGLYLADRAAGTLDRRHKYGFNGDNRIVAR